MVDLVEVRVLGALSVRTATGTVVDPAAWRTSKTRDLVRLLALKAGQSVPVDTLVEALWPTVDLDRGRASLRTAASRVRGVLGQDHLVRRAGSLVLTGVWVDALAFEALVSTAGQQLSAGHAADAVRSAWEALGLYVADVGEDEPFAESCAEDREHYRRLRRQLVLDAAEAAADLGWLRDAVELGHLALRLDPCAERGYRVLMRSYARLGETEQALGTYERCRTALADAFGADPSRSTSDLHLQVLAPPPPPALCPPLVGRGPVLERVQTAFDAVLEHDRTAAFVLRGPVGSGRQRVADELAALWPHRVVRLRCRAEEHGALSRHLVGLTHRTPSEPVLLVVEDLQKACEQDVLELARLLRRDLGPLVVLATHDDADHRTGAVLLDGVPCDVVDLPGLMREELAVLLTSVLGGAPSGGLLDEVLATAGGRAGAAVTAAADLLRSGELLSGSAGLVRAQWHPRLPVVHAGARLAHARQQAGALGAEVLDLLAVLDRPTEVDPLARLVPAIPAAVHRVLRQLCDLAVVHSGADGYRMQDPVLVQAARSWLRGSTRAALHLRIAEQAVLPPGERADHWSAAGEPALACAAWLEAADDALGRGDDARGRTYLLRVREYAEARSVDVPDRIALHERLAEVERRLGRRAEAVQVLRDAEDLARAGRPDAQARRPQLAQADLESRTPAAVGLGRVVSGADAADDADCQLSVRLLLMEPATALRSSLSTASAAARTAGVLADSLDDESARIRAALRAALPPVLLGAGAGERGRLEGLRQRAADHGDREVLYEVSLTCCLALHELGAAEVSHLWAPLSALAGRMQDATGLQLLDALVSLEHGLLRRCEGLLDELPVRFDAVLVDHSALLLRARLQAALGDRSGAVRLLREIVADPRTPSPGLLSAEAGARLATLSADEDLEQARRALAAALAATAPRTYPREQVCLLQARAAILSVEGRDEAGATLALAAAHAAGRAGLVHQQAESHLLRTALLRRAGDELRARRSLERAADLRQRVGVTAALPLPRAAASVLTAAGPPLPVL